MSTITNNRHTAGDAPTTTVATVATDNKVFRYAAGATRLGLGWIFLWAFLDKLFALGFSTGRDPKTDVVDTFGSDAWIHDGSPTMGFLKFGTKGPLADFYQGFAGASWANWLFMIGLAAIGTALMLGVATRLATGAGVLMLVMMWSAVLAPENNPFLDDHLIYALVLVMLAAVGAGRFLGLGGWWERLTIVQQHPILK